MKRENPPPGSAAVTVEGFVQRFEPAQVVHGLSFSVKRGEIYGLVGPDGAGKTTTLRAVAGLIDPTAGTVRVLGHDPREGKTGVRESLGYMPQRYSLYGDLSIAENLRFFSHLFCLKKKDFQRRRERLLAITRLAPFEDRRADALSGGMYKKLALACALLHEPSVLVLDEPTNGVDPISRLELWDLLYTFRDEGMSILVSTSYMDEAARCSRVGLLHQGKMLVEGNPAELVAAFPGKVFTVHEADPTLEERLKEAGLGDATLTPRGSSLRISHGKGAVLETVLRRSCAQVEESRPNFEDLFLELVHVPTNAPAPGRSP